MPVERNTPDRLLGPIKLWTLGLHFAQCEEYLEVISMVPEVRLSKREKEVFELLLQGKSNKQIALSLDIAVRTVEFHLKNVYAKFQVSSRVELVLKLGHATHPPALRAGASVPRTPVSGGTAQVDALGYSTVAGREKTPKIEAGSIHKWIGLHLEVQSL